MSVRLLPALLSFSLLAACTSPAEPLPVPQEEPVPPPAQTVPPPGIEPVILPPDLTPSDMGKPVPPILPPVTEPPRPAQPVQPAWSDPVQGKALLGRLLPSKIPDRTGWQEDIFNAFRALKIPYNAEYFCAANAVIEQESTWQADPVVPGLGKMVWGQVEQKAHAKGVPLALVRAALQVHSRDGRSYAARIDALRTETEMNALFEELLAEAGRLGLPVKMQNPIRTGGPMQVSVEFADAHVKSWPYPYPVKDSIRHEVFSRKGGVYFGIAILLHYRAPYSDMLYRFADYNAGRYASRNAAFQAALVRLDKQKMALDGDLLRYDNGRPAASASSTQAALYRQAGKLKLSQAEINRDLALEKLGGFDQTPLYQRLFQLADTNAGKPLPRAVLPQIRLSSPKITRKLTTEWFARRVDGRYQTCLARAGEAK
ncbi:DUF1615 domain-containing protein [Chitinimonas sp.]|uniref:DUF1615 domain-containing protein n=1 Tax=Chitinimonas sp. TaxID=1934313 RepID=UPI002F95D85C